MLGSLSKRLEDLSLVQRERLAYIDFRLYFFGEIGRPDLIERFGVAPAGATRDLALYREIAPHNITFDGSNKIYRIGQEFSPLFEHASLRVLSALSLGFGDGVNGSMQALLPCESPAALSIPKMDVLATICRGIHAKRPVAIRYYSMSSGESERVIVPFALVDTGMRWHVPLIARVESFGISSSPASKHQPNERQDNDIQWTRIVELDFVPYPSVERPDIIKMDYRRCHADPRAQFIQEPGRQARPENAPDQEGEPVLLWHEGAHRR